ncbi:hypothetical protein JAAARDRAFT_61408 [Jaapia argillacea MUCL 33604]|uniref:Uncharacterized protein n=1 Tax=Jaapia argillacea MUCL 33604 TaxID=933084 RepID=A0A067PF57_9AGAM|nr:hypothetical protein JAAARDRAFT_61408 [Jaapia argillacea MUCL 33604]
MSNSTSRSNKKNTTAAVPTDTAPATPTPASKKRKTHTSEKENENVPTSDATPAGTERRVTQQANGKCPTMSQKNADLEKKLADAKEAQSRAEAAREQAERQLRKFKKIAKAKQQVHQEKAKIAHPKGQSGRANGFNLRRAMGLGSTNNTAKYLSILRTIRDLVTIARLDCQLDFHNQPPGKLAEIYQLARKKQEYLENFINNWATAEIARQFLANRRKQENKDKATRELEALGQAGDDGLDGVRAAKKQRVSGPDLQDEGEGDDEPEGEGDEDDEPEDGEGDEGEDGNEDEE